MRATTNKQTDDPTGWRWPLTFFGGERATRESELSRPLYHAGWVALLLSGAFVLLLVEALLIGRGLPLALGLVVLWWLARPCWASGCQRSRCATVFGTKGVDRRRTYRIRHCGPGWRRFPMGVAARRCSRHA